MEFEKKVCPDCKGSGVYQEYDEYDRYHVHACYQCNGSGEILHQSITNEEGHFPLEAEREYNKLFEDKCIKTGLNLVDIFYPSSDDAVQVVQNAKTIVKKKYDDFRSYNIQGDCYKYVCSCDHCKQPLWEIPDYQYVKNERGHTPNYCPNCGSKLN